MDVYFDLGYDNWCLWVGYILWDNVGMGVGIVFVLDLIGWGKSKCIEVDLFWVDLKFR